MDKKAQFVLTGEIMLWVARYLFLAVVLVFMVLVIGTGIGQQDTSLLKHELITHDILYSCFIIEEERVYPGRFLLENFNQNRFDQCFSGDDNLGIYLQLDYNENNEDKNVKLILNEDLIIESVDCLRKGFECKKTKHPVLLVKTNKEIMQGTLTIRSFFQ